MTHARALVAFARPHTIIGTVVAVLSLWVAAIAWVDPDGTGAWGVLATTLVAALATNVYIVGINQLTDVDIDRINKPGLPLAAGTMTIPTGRLAVATSAVIALVAGAFGGPFLLAAIVIGLVIGSAYSVPPLRLKRFHVAAAAAIASVRALVVNLLIFAHFETRLGGASGIPRHIWALTGMVLGLTIAIAWFKDIPDAAGDARHNIATLVLRLGTRRVLAIGLSLLAACYLAMIVGGLVGLVGVNGAVLAVGHAVLLIALVALTLRIDITDTDSLTTFYRNIWRLFFAEYVVFTLAVVTAGGA